MWRNEKKEKQIEHENYSTPVTIRMSNSSCCCSIIRHRQGDVVQCRLSNCWCWCWWSVRTQWDNWQWRGDLSVACWCLGHHHWLLTAAFNWSLLRTFHCIYTNQPSIVFTHSTLNTSDKYAGSVPTHYAAVRLELHNLNSNHEPDLYPLSSTGTSVTPAQETFKMTLVFLHLVVFQLKACMKNTSEKTARPTDGQDPLLRHIRTTTQ